MLLDPPGESSLIEIAGGQRHEDSIFLLLRDIESDSVQAQEQKAGHERGAFVSVDERMITDDSRRVCRSELRWRGFGPAVGVQLFRSCQCGPEKSNVAHAYGASVLGELSLMNREHDRVEHPDGHFHADVAIILAKPAALSASWNPFFFQATGFHELVGNDVEGGDHVELTCETWSRVSVPAFSVRRDFHA